MKIPLQQASVIRHTKYKQTPYYFVDSSIKPLIGGGDPPPPPPPRPRCSDCFTTFNRGNDACNTSCAGSEPCLGDCRLALLPPLRECQNNCVG